MQKMSIQYLTLGFKLTTSLLKIWSLNLYTRDKILHSSFSQVLMNMGNVMGNVEWLSKNIRSEGRFSIGSTGHKNMYIGLGLNGLKLEAKAGIVGGSIDLGRIDAYCHLREDNQTDPFHEVKVILKWAVVVVQLVERSLLTPDICSSNPVIDNFIYCIKALLKRRK